MTGKFTEIDPQRCEYYAKFMKDLTLPQANAIFWCLFMLVLAMMFISSWQHHRSASLIDLEKGMDPEEIASAEHREHVFQQRRGYFCIVVLCFILSFACIVFECFALFNIEFCDGEDLTQMYWGFWSILQVGSLIAIGGVLLQFWIILSGVGTPPWAVALGTPVLVFAALGWMFKHISDAFWAKLRNRYRSSSHDSDSSDEEKGEEEGVNRWISRAPTLVPESGLNSSDELSEPSPSDKPSPKRMATM